ncbi:MAG: type II secretion system protein, partial [Deltaproteobacteria bacterium]|nr:type II secretion system protein [Deltaproteobacteria bacterium]
MIRSNNGFTLLEVLVAIAIMGFTMVLVQSTTSQMLDAKDRIEERDLLYQSGRVAMRKLTDDLTQAFLIGKGSTNSNVAFGNPLELPTSPTTITRTVPKPIAFFIGKDGGERDSLKFTSFSHLRFIKDTKESDQAKIEYAMEPSKEDPRIFHLVRKEIPWLDDRTEINTGGLV